MKIKHVKAFTALSSASFVQMLIQIVRGKLMAVVLAPAGIGVLNQLLSLSNMFSNVSGLGFFSGVVREVAKSHGEGDDEAIKREVSSAAIFLVTLALAITAVGVILSGWLSQLIFDDGGKRAGFVALTLLSVPIGVAVQVYRALLSGMRHVAGIIKTRIYGDLVSLVVLIALIVPLGLQGAVLAFVVSQIITLFWNVRNASQAVGVEFVKIRWSYFSWKHVRGNVSIGLVSVLIGGLTTLTILVPSRWIISRFGVDDNGLFVTAWRISSVYIGAIHATSHSYVFPTLAAARNDREMSTEMDNNLKLYMLAIPPIILVIIAGGDILMRVLFTAEFTSAATLLCLLLPGDVFRITFETMALAFWAKKNAWRSLALKCWVFFYLGLVWLLLPQFGLMGVAGAYFIAQVASVVAVWIAIHRRFGFRMSGGGALAMLRGVLLTMGGGAATLYFGYGLTSRAVCAALLVLWLGLTLMDPGLRAMGGEILTKVRARLRGGRKGEA